jgi:hypothetical protein
MIARVPVLITPASARDMGNPARQARLRRLIRYAGTDLVALDGTDETAVGLLLARTAIPTIFGVWRRSFGQ